MVTSPLQSAASARKSLILGARCRFGYARKIEIAYPQAFCRAAKAGGARVCGVMTAGGADPKVGMKYAKIIGEKERAVESVKFDFLGTYRPGVILGNSNTPGVLGYVMPLLHWAMPSKYHSIHKNDLARAMVAQSEQAFLAITQGNGPKEATVKILEYKEMEPFFVKGRERRALTTSFLARELGPLVTSLPGSAPARPASIIQNVFVRPKSCPQPLLYTPS